jgi:hypothetical protein
MAEAYNIPQLLTLGAPEDQELKKGRTFKIDIPRNEMGQTVGDARYLAPGESLSEQDALITGRIEQLGLSLGLSRSVITGQAASSGYELALAKHEILERNRADREYYRPAVTELVRVMMLTAERSGTAAFPDDRTLPSISARYALRSPTWTRPGAPGLVGAGLARGWTLCWKTIPTSTARRPGHCAARTERERGQVTRRSIYFFFFCTSRRGS